MLYQVRLDGRLIGTVAATNDDDALLFAMQKFEVSVHSELGLMVERRQPGPGVWDRQLARISASYEPPVGFIAAKVFDN